MLLYDFGKGLYNFGQDNRSCCSLAFESIPFSLCHLDERRDLRFLKMLITHSINTDSSYLGMTMMGYTAAIQVLTMMQSSFSPLSSDVRKNMNFSFTKIGPYKRFTVRCKMVDFPSHEMTVKRLASHYEYEIELFQRDTAHLHLHHPTLDNIFMIDKSRRMFFRI